MPVKNCLVEASALRSLGSCGPPPHMLSQYPRKAAPHHPLQGAHQPKSYSWFIPSSKENTRVMYGVLPLPRQLFQLCLSATSSSLPQRRPLLPGCFIPLNAAEPFDHSVARHPRLFIGERMAGAKRGWAGAWMESLWGKGGLREGQTIVSGWNFPDRATVREQTCLLNSHCDCF